MPEITDEDIRNAATPGKAAGLWWGRVMSSPRHTWPDGTTDQDLTDHANEEIRRENPDFETALRSLIDTIARKVDEELDSLPVYGYEMGSDYECDAYLDTCAQEAGFKVRNCLWPNKTWLQTAVDYVRVVYGEKGEWVTIWGHYPYKC
jgi:hypothetical protein